MDKLDKMLNLLNKIKEKSQSTYEIKFSPEIYKLILLNNGFGSYIISSSDIESFLTELESYLNDL